MFEDKRIAIIHDWYETVAGSERVVEQILTLVPHADLFAVVDFLPEAQRDVIRHKPVTTTFIQRLPFARKHFRAYLGLMPLAIEQLDLRAYEIIISSSHAVAKGVICGPDQLHICYCHTPIRYAWDFQAQYLENAGLNRGLKGITARWLLHYLRLWDQRAAAGVDYFIANSAYIARRIRKAYRRQAEIIYPPVDTESFTFSAEKGNYYLTASRLVPYKRVDLIVKAFQNLPDLPLLVAGDGPERKHLRAGKPDHIQFLGHLPGSKLIELMQGAKAFIFAAEEDFGIVPIEAQACGTPVIAYGKGGVCESIPNTDSPHPCGILFTPQTPDALISAVRQFENDHARIRPENCRTNAEQFSRTVFKQKFAQFLENCAREFDQRLA
ncbi:MAG: glycosyltransferase [Anaerolineaceae bacterium]|nr:glycosyltransferase [Anaerolineaceae bacterium]